MDCNQPAVDDTAPLIALVQCLVRAAAEGEVLPPSPLPEIVDENHFAAARDNGAARQGRAVGDHCISGVAATLADAYVSQALSSI